MSYNAPPNYGPGPGQPYAREVDVAIIGETWGYVKDKIGDYVLMGLVIVLASIVINFSYSWLTLGFTSEAFRGPAFGTSAFFIDLVIQFVGYGVIGILEGGLMLYAMMHVRGQAPTFQDFSKGMQNAGALFVSGILVNIMTTIAVFFCCFPALIVGGLTMFTVPLIVDRNLGAVDAISESWRMLASQWLKAALFILVAGLVAFLGLLACGVGILVTMPLMYASMAVMYVRMNDAAPQSSASPYPRGGGPGSGIGQPPPPQGPTSP
jgi:hypothetical protein